ncbi:sushi repeat-containing protein SRPX2 isoform X2 [Scleropages formosus]|uniref:Sushi repeat-containing protein SRPX2 n=1 Tax=Scleropages formosus TaxID=113540 RepID=A0A8C9RBB9_SCLFO|nr:sushi repeat-containing protein SRPX2 isoform X2 [Scleropages formosus]XP_018589184.1 sushi repeat-containing protein SRPX2 isoform X2 [Scleropages formosus]
MCLFQRYGLSSPAPTPSTLPKGSGTALQNSHNEVVHDVQEEETYHTPQLDYKEPRWCHTMRLPNGEVTCFSPRGPNYRSTLGTRCELTCDRGFRLLGRASVQCMPTRRWSGTALCRQQRCHVLPLIFHGTYSCTKGVLVDSKCDYTCNPGYMIEGANSRMCQEGGTWSGREPTCADRDPPKIQCPLSRVRIADPGQLTAKVTWDPPVVKDTADVSLTDVTLVGQMPGSSFEEGIHVIRYKVYDQARNKAACKFVVRVEVRRCPTLPQPLHGYLTCSADGNNYGAECEYHCEQGYERQGPRLRVCQFDRSWSDVAPTCVQTEINVKVETAGALLDQFYDKRRLLIVSTPNKANEYYKLQELMLEKADCGLDMRKVTVIELLGRAPHAVGRIKDKHLDPMVIKELRLALRISRTFFSMVLLDKRGVDRERFREPVSLEELYSVIDMYLLNEEEHERLEPYKSLCD